MDADAFEAFARSPQAGFFNSAYNLFVARGGRPTWCQTTAPLAPLMEKPDAPLGWRPDASSPYVARHRFLRRTVIQIGSERQRRLTQHGRQRPLAYGFLRKTIDQRRPGAFHEGILATRGIGARNKTLVACPRDELCIQLTLNCFQCGLIATFLVEPEGRFAKDSLPLAFLAGTAMADNEVAILKIGPPDGELVEEPACAFLEPFDKQWV